MRRIALALLLIVAALALPVVSFAQDDQPPLIFALSGQPGTFLPGYAQLATEGYAFSLIYSSLVKPDGAGGYQPDLAESWEVSPDNLTWTFKLRPDVLWHDGEPFTANDVKFTFAQPADPEYTGTDYTDIFVGAAERKTGTADDVSGIQVIDDYTISFTTTEPIALFLESVGRTSIVPEHVFEDIPLADYASSPLGHQPIGTGPYRVTEWVPDQTITFEAFDDYFGEKAHIKTFIWKIIPDPGTQVTALLTGEISGIPAAPADEVEGLRANPDLTTIDLIGSAGYFVRLNHDKPFFKDIRVRQALSHAIDSQGLLNAVAGGIGTPNLGPLFPGLPETNADLKGYSYDPDLAKSLLAEAGWTDDDGDGIVESHGVEGLEDGTPFSITVGTYSQASAVARLQVVQQLWKAIGIDVAIDSQETNNFFTLYFDPNTDYDAAQSGWFNLIIPSLSDLSGNYGSTGENALALHWKNDELDQLIAQIPTIFDPAERNAAFWRAQEIIEQELPVIFLDRPGIVAAVSSKLIVPEIESQAELYATLPQWQWAN